MILSHCCPAQTAQLNLERLPNCVQIQSTYNGISIKQTGRDAKVTRGDLIVTLCNDSLLLGSGPNSWPTFQQENRLAERGCFFELEDDRCAILTKGGDAMAIFRPRQHLTLGTFKKFFHKRSDAGSSGDVDKAGRGLVFLLA
jgi:hypothetical protein